MKKSQLRRIIRESIRELYSKQKRINKQYEAIGLPTSNCGKNPLTEQSSVCVAPLSECNPITNFNNPPPPLTTSLFNLQYAGNPGAGIVWTGAPVIDTMGSNAPFDYDTFEQGVLDGDWEAGDLEALYDCCLLMDLNPDWTSGGPTYGSGYVNVSGHPSGTMEEYMFNLVEMFAVNATALLAIDPSLSNQPSGFGDYTLQEMIDYYLSLGNPFDGNSNTNITPWGLSALSGPTAYTDWWNSTGGQNQPGGFGTGIGFSNTGTWSVQCCLAAECDLVWGCIPSVIGGGACSCHQDCGWTAGGGSGLVCCHPDPTSNYFNSINIGTAGAPSWMGAADGFTLNNVKACVLPQACHSYCTQAGLNALGMNNTNAHTCCSLTAAGGNPIGQVSTGCTNPSASNYNGLADPFNVDAGNCCFNNSGSCLQFCMMSPADPSCNYNQGATCDCAGNWIGQAISSTSVPNPVPNMGQQGWSPFISAIHHPSSGNTSCCTGGPSNTGVSTLCFTEDSKVSMASGEEKKISEIELGEKVKSEIEESTVTGIDIHKGTHTIYSINSSKAFVTSDHPFKTIEGWKAINPKDSLKNHGVEATSLQEGDILITKGGTEEIKSIEASEEKVNVVYNLKLDNEHVYYVNGYLVHNDKNVWEPTSTDPAQEFAQGGPGWTPCTSDNDCINPAMVNAGGGLDANGGLLPDNFVPNPNSANGNCCMTEAYKAEIGTIYTDIVGWADGLGGGGMAPPQYPPGFDTSVPFGHCTKCMPDGWELNIALPDDPTSYGIAPPPPPTDPIEPTTLTPGPEEKPGDVINESLVKRFQKLANIKK